MEDYKGKVYPTNTSGKLKVLDYINAESVHVMFIDSGYKTIATMGRVKRGQVKDPLHRSVYGVGFIGDGFHKTHDNGKHTKEYK